MTEASCTVRLPSSPSRSSRAMMMPCMVSGTPISAIPFTMW